MCGAWAVRDRADTAGPAQAGRHRGTALLEGACGHTAFPEGTRCACSTERQGREAGQRAACFLAPSARLWRPSVPVSVFEMFYSRVHLKHNLDSLRKYRSGKSREKTAPIR